MTGHVADAPAREELADAPAREELATLRGRVTRRTSAGLAALTLLLAGVAALTGVEASAWQPTLALALALVTAGYHLAITALPWEGWAARSTGDLRIALHLAISIGLIGVGIAITEAPVAVALLWLFTLTTAQAAATGTVAGQAATFVATTVVAVAAATIGGGVAVTDLVVALAAIGALALLFGSATRQYLTTVAREVTARAAADDAADRALVLGDASRVLVAEEPEEVLDAIVETTARLGYGYSGVYAHDAVAREVRYVAARGLSPELQGRRFPDDVGVAGMVLGAGATVIIDDYGAHPRANPAFADILQVAIGTPIRDRQGTMTGVLVCGRDDAAEVTEADQQVFELLAAHAGRALELAEGLRDERRRVHELAELDRLKSDFLATVSHELRTPLTVVCGLSRTLSDRWDDLEPTLKRSLLDRIEANATALDDVIATLLDFGRLEAGRLQVEATEFDLSDVVQRTTSRLGSVLASHELYVEVVPGVLVTGDPRLIDRVVENLLTNAARHTPAGTRVEVRVSADGDHGYAEIADGGDGIPHADLARIGERFFRGGRPETRSTRGVGLGLALAREVLQLHGSDLEVRSAVGDGTAFSFRLPRVLSGAHSGA